LNFKIVAQSNKEYLPVSMNHFQVQLWDKRRR